jgi:hypothetical protein
MFKSKEERNALIAKLYFGGKSNEEIIAELRERGYQDLKDTHSLSAVISKLKKKGAIPAQKPDLARIEKEWLWEIGRMFGRIKGVSASRRKR